MSRKRDALRASGTAALLLAAMGIFGVVAAAVTRRRHEPAVRLAVGAEHGGVLRLVVRDAASLVAGGVLGGAPAVLAAGGLLRDAPLIGDRPGRAVTKRIAAADAASAQSLRSQVIRMK